MYNKRFYQKKSDKKVLHKVRKQWVTISLALLMMLGGGALATHVNASASQVTQKAPITYVQNKKQNNNGTITHQATQLHHQLLNHASINQNSNVSQNHRVITKTAKPVLKSHFKRTNNVHALAKSGYNSDNQDKGHFIFNKYAPNDRRARIPKTINIRHHNWAKGKLGNLNLTVYLHRHNGWIKGSRKTTRKYRSTFKNFDKMNGLRPTKSKRSRYHYRKHHAGLVRRHHGYRKYAKHYRKHMRKHYRKSHRYGHKYLIANKHGHNVIFSNVHSNGTLDNVIKYDKSTGRSKILKRKKVLGFNFDLIDNPDIQEWVFANELSNHKHAKVNGKKDLYDFRKAVMHHYYSSSDQEQIGAIRHQYNYLEKHENGDKIKTASQRANYRQHVIDWVNFYRTYLYNLQPVSENTSYDKKAQQGADTGNDPEDMLLGSPEDKTAMNPSDVAIYFTDTDDADHDGTPGHRTSVLNPRASEVGVGAKGGQDTLFFRWGLNNSVSNSDNDIIAYPNEGIFPIGYANQGHEDYWGASFIDPNGVNSDSIPSNYRHILIRHPQVSVHDDTAHKDVDVRDVHNDGSLRSNGISYYNSAIYYKVNINQLKANHKYTITISGDNIPNGSYSYTTKLFRL